MALPNAATAGLLKHEPVNNVVVEFTSAPTVDDMHALQRAGFVGPFEKFDLVPVIAASASPSAVARLRSLVGTIDSSAGSLAGICRWGCGGLAALAPGGAAKQQHPEHDRNPSHAAS